MQGEAVYDRAAELKAFDETKTGVKGLVDMVVTKVPRIFVLPPEQRISPTTPVTDPAWRVPTLDISREKLGGSHRQDLVEAIRAACETWGFFQVVGHGVPMPLMERVIEGIGAFNEGEIETKAALYSREPNRAVKYSSNFDLYQSPVANWRDTLYCRMAPDPPSPAELPADCRETMFDYSKHVMKLGSTLFKLLSEALGLHSNYLEDINCNQGQILLAHYYPPCPEPELTIGTSQHSDSGFLSILLQDQVGGLQVLYQDQWVDIHPVSGAFVVNIGDLLQLISNDSFKSVEHRVIAKSTGPRISVACFFSTHFHPASTRIYGPIKELLTKDNPPIYKETKVKDYMKNYYAKGLVGKSALFDYRL